MPRRLASVLRTYSALVATALLPLLAATGEADAQLPQVHLYEHTLYGGQLYPLVLLAASQNTVMDLGSFGGKTTSLRWYDLPANVTVVFYEHRFGAGAEYRISRTHARTGGDPNVGPTHNDTFSSWSWHYDDPSIGGTVTLYEHSDGSGLSVRLPLSSYAPGQAHPLPRLRSETSAISWDLQENAS